MSEGFVVCLTDFCLRWVFAALLRVSLAAESGGYSSCALRPAHRGGFSCCGAPQHGRSGLGFVALRHVGSFWTRD